MSDVLTYVILDVVLHTRLAHVKSLRTTEILDINYLLLVSGKPPSPIMLELAGKIRRC